MAAWEQKRAEAKARKAQVVATRGQPFRERVEAVEAEREKDKGGKKAQKETRKEMKRLQKEVEARKKAEYSIIVLGGMNRGGSIGPFM